MSASATAARNSPDDVCVIGCGAVTALGYGVGMTAASMRASLSGFRESRLVDKTGQPITLSLVPVYSESLHGADRLAALAHPAALEAMAPAWQEGFARDLLADMAICLGTALPRPGLTDEDARSCLSQLASKLPVFGSGKSHQVTFSGGHAAFLMCMERAVTWIRTSRERFVLVGGVDSYYDASTLEWLDRSRRLHSAENKDGFIPGEAAGFCLLTSVSTALRFGFTPLAIILASCSTEEPCPFTSDGVCTGVGLTSVLHRALSALEPGDLKADWTLCDMNGESFRGSEWVYAYLRTGRRHADPLEIWHPADCLGDVGAASGGVLVALAIAAWQRNYARGDRALIWTSSDNEHRAAALLQTPEQGIG